VKHDSDEKAVGPLRGVKIVDLTIALSGPWRSACSPIKAPK
jgi:crotonobetainyl-CoA:carnitine CoA-transferase CaiB-like acyl-CoA transferase